MTSSLGDGHTAVMPSGKYLEYTKITDDKRIPDIEFDYVDGKIYLYEQNKCLEVAEINGISSDEIIERCKQSYDSENEYAIKKKVRSFKLLIVLVKLDIAKTMDNKVEISYYDTDNHIEKKSYHFQYLPREKRPSWESEFNTQENYAVLTINECIKSEEFKQYLDNFFEKVVNENIDFVAIDLRKN